MSKTDKIIEDGNNPLCIISIVLIIGLGVYHNNFSISHRLDHLLGSKKTYVGVIASSPIGEARFNKKYYLKLKSLISESGKKEEALEGKVHGQFSKYEDYSRGDKIQFLGTIKKPKKAFLPRLFSEERCLKTKGIHYVIKVEPGSSIYLSNSKEPQVKKVFNTIRDKIIINTSHHLKGDNQLLVNSILFGHRASKLPKDLKFKIRELGLSHIVSASGFNLSILIFTLITFFKTRKRLLKLILSISLVFFYSGLAGFAPSILRASSFLYLILIGRFFNLRIKLLPTVALILIIYFLVSPLSLLDIGFQFSLLAYLGLMVFFKDRKNLIINLLTQTLIAQIILLPLIVFYFHKVQLLSLLSCLIATPLAAMILVLGLIFSAFSLIPLTGFIQIVLAKWLVIFSSLFLEWINFLHQVPLKSIYIPYGGLQLLLLTFTVIISFGLFLSSTKYKQILLKVFLSSLLVLTGSITYKHLITKVKVIILPTYNKTSILIISKNSNATLYSNKITNSDKWKVEKYLALNHFNKKISYKSLNEFTEIPGFKYIDNLSSPISSNKSTIMLPMIDENTPKVRFKSPPKIIVINDRKHFGKIGKERLRGLEEYCLLNKVKLHKLSNGYFATSF